ESVTVINKTIDSLVNRIIRSFKASLSKRIVTLDINNDSVKLLEMRGGRILRWASIYLEADKDEDESFSGKSALGAKTKQLMDSTGIKAKKIMVSFSGQYSIYRMIPATSLPNTPNNQQAIQEIVNDFMPLPLEQLYFSWQNTLTNDGREYFHLFGIPRETLNTIVQELKSVGITPRTLEPRGIALARLINRKQAIVLNIEKTSIDILLINGGLLEIMRTIIWHKDELTSESQVDFLTRNLEATVDFYNSQNSEEPLDTAIPFFITGQVSEDQTITEKLQKRLGYKFEPLEPFMERPEHIPINQYAGNIGLTSKGSIVAQGDNISHYSPFTVNFMPQIHRSWKPSAMQIYSVLFIIIALSLLMPTLQVTQRTMNETDGLQVKRDVLNETLLQKKAKIGKRLPLEEAVKEYEIITTMNINVTEDVKTVNDLAQTVGISLKSITHNVTNLSVECVSDNYTVFRNYLTALEASGVFSTPVPPPEGYPYTTKGTIKLTPNSENK
ncbi:type IV pilus biogenesis protein PilM, partial [Chloroflexota bacterium]